MDGMLVRPLVKSLLRNAKNYEWTVQGLGMLRTYLDSEQVYRLHVWHKSIKVPEVSGLHSHPWDFVSYVISGCIWNTRYTFNTLYGEPYFGSEIRCGPGGGVVKELPERRLMKGLPECYIAGETYFMTSDEIHSSDFSDGTVSIIKRRFLNNRDNALVFWEPGSEWVSAESRPATLDEVENAVNVALENWVE